MEVLPDWDYTDRDKIIPHGWNQTEVWVPNHTAIVAIQGD